MRFFTIVPVFNRVALTVKCLDTLMCQTDEGRHIILVDDGSTDGTSQIVHNRFPEVKILSGNGDLWWTGAVNLGIRYVLSIGAPDDYVLLVNNDTYFDRDFISSCRTAAGQYPEALIGSVIVDSPTSKTILTGGCRINWYTAKYHDLNAGKNLDLFPQGYIEAVSVLTGRGVVIPVKAFREVGLYDHERLKHRGDTELPRRANLRGFPLYVCYDMVTYNSDTEMRRRLGAERFKLRDWYDYFFDIRSAGNLRTRFWFSMNTASNPVQGLCYLTMDIIRVTAHFVRNLDVGMRSSKERAQARGIDQ